VAVPVITILAVVGPAVIGMQQASPLRQEVYIRLLLVAVEQTQGLVADSPEAPEAILLLAALLFLITHPFLMLPVLLRQSLAQHLLLGEQLLTRFILAWHCLVLVY
jgi:hypothetical protein